MIKSTTHFYLFVLALCTLTSCTSSFLRYSTVLPPKVVPSGYTSVKLIYLYDTANVPLDKVIYLNRDKDLEAYHEVHAHFVQQLHQALEEDLRLNIEVQQIASTGSPAEDQTFINYALDTSQAQLLILASDYTVDWDQDVEVFENEDGDKTRIAYYSLVGNNTFTFFGLPIQNGKRQVLYQENIECAAFVEEREVLSGILAIGPNFRNNTSYAIQAVDCLVNRTVQLFYPTEVSRDRQYYRDGILEQAGKSMLHQNWQKAEEELKRCWKVTSDVKEQYKIAHNFSVVYEAMGNAQLQQKWAKEKERRKGKGYKKAYSY